MKKQNKIYKLYNDNINKPTKDLYLKPTLIGVGSAIGTSLAPLFELSDHPITYVFGGASILIFSYGLKKALGYKEAKKEYEEQLKLFEIFKTEVKKVLGEDVNLDLSNVLNTTKLNFGSLDFPSIGTAISFKDGTILTEIAGEDFYSCFFHFSEDREDKIELTNVIDKVYSLNDKNKTK